MVSTTKTIRILVIRCTAQLAPKPSGSACHQSEPELHNRHRAAHNWSTGRANEACHDSAQRVLYVLDTSTRKRSELPDSFLRSASKPVSAKERSRPSSRSRRNNMHWHRAPGYRAPRNRRTLSRRRPELWRAYSGDWFVHEFHFPTELVSHFRPILGH